MKAIEDVKNVKMIFVGAAVILGAIVIAALGVLDIVALRIGSLALGSWAMYVAAAVVAGIGILVIIAASDQPRCVRCRRFLESHEAYFPLEALNVVQHAVSTGDPSPLATLPAVPKNQMKSVVSVTYCPSCREVGRVSAEKWQDMQQQDVVPAREVLGPPLRMFADIADRHVEGRGEDE
jgi:hypothetical protein